jgi:putative cardiolipin synthase
VNGLFQLLLTRTRRARTLALHGKGNVRTITVLVAAFLLLAGCASAPPPPAHADSAPECVHVYDPDDPVFVRADGTTAPRSAFYPIDDSMQALRLRLALTQIATKRIDVQTFIWKTDETGQLLVSSLMAAADRGVKVRLLVDDVSLGGLDDVAIMLDQHPNLEIRIYNPFASRGKSWLARGPEWFFNRSRLNHRMHNKLFLVDDARAIVGGRNVANEYFGLGSVRDFRDFELLVDGPVVARLDDSFEIFWNSRWSYRPAELTDFRPSPEEVAEFRQARRTLILESDRLREAFDPLRQDWAQELEAVADGMIRAPARAVFDCPQDSGDITHVSEALDELLGSSTDEVFIASPYVVLDKQARRRLADFADLDSGVVILTNSLESADHNITFSAYTKRRRFLLRNGVRIHELEAHGEQWHEYRLPSSTGQYLSLHAKVIIFDREEVYVGSFNLDPRSRDINAEIGLLIRSKDLAERILGGFERDLDPANSWRVDVDERNRLYWKSDRGEYFRQPARSTSQRVRVMLLSFLPVDSQL